ncbi:hypothetical protein DVH24_042518 [Malus domestica]|uniref:Uncharacterized protein n=1 Tax=Malus domestica TaxID=3750 RepID=A0A498JFC6_MALDO|nr:hypothetical protein DVH24_042518 [Malus domestica]
MSSPILISNDVYSPHNNALNSINNRKNNLYTLNRTSIWSLGTVKLVVQVEPYNHLVTFHFRAV